MNLTDPFTVKKITFETLSFQIMATCKIRSKATKKCCFFVGGFIKTIP